MINDFKLNIELFYFINSFAGLNEYLNIFFIFIGKYLIYLMIFFILIYFFFLLWKKKIHLKEIIFLNIALLTPWLIVKLIKISFPTERPFYFLNEVNKLIEKEPLDSFPSGHAVFAFSLAFILFYKNKKIGYLFLFLASLVSIGRILVGVHYPLDILIGFLISLLTPLLIFFFKKNII